MHPNSVSAELFIEVIEKTSQAFAMLQAGKSVSSSFQQTEAGMKDLNIESLKHGIHLPKAPGNK